jgi:hypothetical protein
MQSKASILSVKDLKNNDLSISMEISTPMKVILFFSLQIVYTMHR